MKNRVAVYWWCQIFGWSTYFLVAAFFYFTLRTKPQPNFFSSLLLEITIGLLMTQVIRMITNRLQILQLSLQKQIEYLFVVTLVFAFLWGVVYVWMNRALGFETVYVSSLSFLNKLTRATFNSFLLLLIWNLFYFAYHYVAKSRAEQLDKMRLESTVKELELKTIKAHINPHFIFNALNSIRALVDENPSRARTAITELSNILRSSMQAEKSETASLERELNIVKDYLALEHMRFEDRLNVEYKIDEDTLDQQVPPMMLQTLVENAIKHGISKQVNGGHIKIISDFRGDYHELIVQNTGHLNGNLKNADGFGLASTENRLQLLYGSKADFKIHDIDGNIVEARVRIPVQSL
jgi:two-component system, LytTR family, sensor kinase